MSCPNCKEHWKPGETGHFVPPSMGESGFFHCIGKDARRGFKEMTQPGSGPDRHIAKVNHGPDKIEVTCSCGNKWSHQLTTPDEEIVSIFESHLRYFNKPKKEPD